MPGGHHFTVSQHKECVVSFTVLEESNSGEHKVRPTHLRPPVSAMGAQRASGKAPMGLDASLLLFMLGFAAHQRLKADAGLMGRIAIGVCRSS